MEKKYRSAKTGKYVTKKVADKNKDTTVAERVRKVPKRKTTVVAVSGGFDPLHLGHVRMFREAKKLGGKLVVIINSDDWLRRKKGGYFMSAPERAELISELGCVDQVYIHKSVKADVCGALEAIKPNIFANGGDRKCEDDIPEAEVCKKLGIDMAFNVGGRKIRSSSDMLKLYCETVLRKQ